MAFKSSRCMFSISAISITCSSAAVFTYAGIVLKPTCFEALYLLSPAIIKYVPSSFLRSVIGEITPNSLIDADNSASASSSKCVLGWFGFAKIKSSSTSLIDDEPLVLIFSVSIKAPKPLPKPNPVFFAILYWEKT